MNVAPGAPVEPAGPPSMAAPPGDPPEAFDQVLGAEQARAEAHGRDSARTARAEGAERTKPGVSTDSASTEPAGPHDSPSVPPPPESPEPPAGQTPVPGEGPPGLGVPEGIEPRGELPPGLARRDELPPGLARRDALPPGLARRQPDAAGLTDPAPTSPEIVGPPVVSSGEPVPPSPVPGSTPTPSPDPASSDALPVGVDPEHATPAPGTATSVAEPAAEVETILNHRELSLLADRAPVDPDTAPVPASAVPERTPHGFLRAESGDRTTPGAADARAASVATTGTPGDQTSTTAGGGSDGEPAHPGRSGQPQPAASVDQPASTQAAPAAAPVTGTGPIGRELVGRPPAELPARARLGELADVAATVIRLAARDGKAAARITLRPAELGEVEIRLRYHAGGISADVVAESSQAAQTLSQAAGELRRSLESQGLVVHWLDVRTGDEGRRAWQEGWHPGRGGARGHDHLDDPPEGLTAIEAAALPAASGSVDVLA